MNLLKKYGIDTVGAPSRVGNDFRNSVTSNEAKPFKKSKLSYYHKRSKEIKNYRTNTI